MNGEAVAWYENLSKHTNGLVCHFLAIKNSHVLNAFSVPYDILNANRWITSVLQVLIRDGMCVKRIFTAAEK